MRDPREHPYDCTKCGQEHDHWDEGLRRPLCDTCHRDAQNTCAECKKTIYYAFVHADDLVDDNPCSYFGDFFSEPVRFCLTCWETLEEESDDWGWVKEKALRRWG